MPLLTKTDARAYLGGISERSLDRIRAAGALTIVKIGGRIMFDQADLDAYIEANKTYRVEDAS